jgi:hypothetical protein
MRAISYFGDKLTAAALIECLFDMTRQIQTISFH